MTGCGMLAVPVRGLDTLDGDAAGGSFGSLSHFAALMYARAHGVAVQCREPHRSLCEVSAEALAWAWRQPVPDHGSLVVLLKLADQANDDGISWPSRRSLARDCRMSTATLDRKIIAMRDAGLIEVEARARENGSQTSNRYLLKMMTPPHHPDPTPSSRRMMTPEPPEEPSEPNGSAHEPNGNGAQALVAHFVDASVAKGANPPRRVVGQIAKLTGELLAEGIPPERITAGMDRLIERGLHPAVLPAAVHEAAVTRSRDGPAAPRKTGWRFVRGSHGSTYVQDPDGTDHPPKGFA